MWHSTQNKTRIAFALVSIMAAFAIYNGLQPRDGAIKFKVKGDTAYVNGTTFSDSYMHVKNVLDENPQLQTLVLQNMPGTRDSFNNLRIARLIRARGLDTRLEKRSRIASGAVDLFIAGNERTMDCGGMIGVHSWGIGDNISPNDIGRDDARPIHEKFLAEMGIDPKFYVFTREAAEPEEIYVMTQDEIERFGLLTETVDCE